jgi:hypothetical protein
MSKWKNEIEQMDASTERAEAYRMKVEQDLLWYELLEPLPEPINICVLETGEIIEG